MEQLTVARSYASAMFELGERSAAHEAYTRAFATVNAAIAADHRVGDFLRSPKIGVDQKKDALKVAFGASMPPLFMNFLLVVLDKRRHRLLPAIASEYDRMLDVHLGRLNVSLTLARQPDATAVADITDRLSKLLETKVIAHVRVEPEIIGGIVVRFGDHVMDGSLRRRLVHMRRDMMAAPLAEKAIQ